MKLNLNTLKIVFAFLVIGGVIVLTVNSVSSLSYSGSNLSFDIASGGSNTLTNPSDDAVAAQLIGTGTMSFRVNSDIEGLSGASTRLGTGNTRTHEFDFQLPPGTSEFSITGGRDVKFVSETDTELQAIADPMSAETRRNTFLIAAVVIFGALFYASQATGHQLVKSLRYKLFPSSEDKSKLETAPAPVAADSGHGQGHSPRSYGDNRSER